MDVATFGWGVLGSAAPEIYRLYQMRESAWTPSARYWWFSALMAFFAGFFAVAASKPDDPLAAIYVGVATPYMISWMVAKASKEAGSKTSAPANDNGEPQSEDYTRIETYDVDDREPSWLVKVGMVSRALFKTGY